MPSAILHVDMDAFFASIEQRDDPALRGRPVLVGGTGPRGVVAAASYEARAFGCRSAMPMAVALRRCPDAVVVKPRGSVYGETGRAVAAILGGFTPLVERLSIDEAFLDLTGTERLHGPPRRAAEAIRAAIRAELSLPASVGIAPNKFLAKLASDLAKPDGLLEVDDAWIATELPRQPIGRMWGVGPAAEGRLRAIGVHAFGDVATIDPDVLARVVGRDAERLVRLAAGRDARRVVPHHDARSISHERTFGEDLAAPADVRAVLRGQAEDVARRLRAQDLFARRVTVKIRFGDFETITRSRTLEAATDRTDAIGSAAAALFDAWASTSFRPVRLIGVAAGALTDDRQLGLFEVAGDDRSRRLDRVTDEVVKRFGRGAVRRGG